MRIVCISVLVVIFSSMGFGGATTRPVSAFYPPEVLARVRALTKEDPRAAELAKRAVEAAKPWREMSDEQLWSLMFGATLPRSWMVWSNGVCPACRKSVPMYDWQVDAIARPWKVRCPHCQELFPTNDFKKFYDSGLDGQGVFDPKKGDRSLLFNVAHPDPNDPKHLFGVDDGTGYVEGNARWRFIPTYLIFGQWKQAVLGGIKSLATAYVLTGDEVYAHKAGVLLHRTATLYPTFSFKAQGVVYEVPSGDGYVSIWHDACIETRELAISYDAVKEGVAGDAALAAFLATKPGAGSPTNGAAAIGPADVIAHIQEGILRDPIKNAHRIYSNYPQQPLTLATIHTALDWPGNRAQVLAMLKPVLDQSTAVDGVTGEKGLAGYSSYAAQQLALYLGYYTRSDPRFLADLVKQNPRVPDMYRFFIQTRCLDRYYPLTGDTGYFAAPVPDYAGVLFSKEHFLGVNIHSSAVLPPSMYSFLYDLYKLTGDASFAQTLYQTNGRSVDGLPYDLFAKDPAAVRRDVAAVIERHGERPNLASVNFANWHIAILRAGGGEHARAAWLDYDAWGGHGHADGMNLGLFASGLDLLPDFGYPPVQFGGWESPRANWYKSTAAHNTVCVDGANQPAAAGTATLFATGPGFSVISANAPGMIPGGTMYARTVAMIDTSPDHSYILDVFRVAGGKDHLKGLSSSYSTLTVSGSGATTQPASPLALPQATLRNPQFHPLPVVADFKVEDRYKLLASPRDVHLRVHDLTENADAYAAEAWVIAGIYNSTEEAWVPRLLTHRRSADGKPLRSTFVSVLDPYEGRPVIQSAKRVALPEDAPETAVAMEVTLADGSKDLILSADSGETSLSARDITAAAVLSVIHFDKEGKPRSLTLCRPKSFDSAFASFDVATPSDLVQIRFADDGPKLVTGGPVEMRQRGFKAGPTATPPAPQSR